MCGSPLLPVRAVLVSCSAAYASVIYRSRTHACVVLLWNQKRTTPHGAKKGRAKPFDAIVLAWQAGGVGVLPKHMHCAQQSRSVASFLMLAQALSDGTLQSKRYIASYWLPLLKDTGVGKALAELIHRPALNSASMHISLIRLLLPFRVRPLLRQCQRCGQKGPGLAHCTADWNAAYAALFVSVSTLYCPEPPVVS